MFACVHPATQTPAGVLPRLPTPQPPVRSSRIQSHTPAIHNFCIPLKHMCTPAYCAPTPPRPLPQVGKLLTFMPVIIPCSCPFEHECTPGPLLCLAPAPPPLTPRPSGQTTQSHASHHLLHVVLPER